jgi:hypothetical protein
VALSPEGWTVVHIPLSPSMFIPLMAPIALVVVLVVRLRSGGGSRTGGGRHSGGGQLNSGISGVADPRFGAEPDPRFATVPDAAYGSAPGSVYGSAPDPRFAPDQQFGSAPDPRFAPDPFGVTNPSLPSVTAASTSVLASGGGASASGEPFPTTGRALAMTGGHALMGLGLLILELSATPIGHHDAHIGSGAVGLLGFVIFFVGASFATFATSRVQRDLMGGGWNSRFATRYISPQIALYVISPAGISAAASRLNIAPVLAMLVIYGLLAADVLLMVAHYFGR